MEEDDDLPQLSAHALGALKEFLITQQEHEERFKKLHEVSEQQFGNSTDADPSTFDISLFTEDWQLSQFWYDDATCEFLANTVMDISNPETTVVFISTPSAYLKLRSLNPSNSQHSYLFEYDKRFNVLGTQFVFYDFNKPFEFAHKEKLKGSVDVLIVDPPFLSNSCQTNTAMTSRFLSKPDGSTKIIVCTGLIMQDLVTRLYSIKRTTFQPIHKGGLANEFGCFSSFETEKLKWR